jgi:hypothetical protein
MECIICRETGPESLIDNTICECKYKIHNSCWIEYVHTTTTVRCLLCRKEIQQRAPHPTSPPVPPTIQVLYTPMLQDYQQPQIIIPAAQIQTTSTQPHRLIHTKYDILIKLSCVVVFILLAILFLRFIIF